MQIQKQTTTAKPRKLTAQWTVDLIDDLRSMHGIDAETEFGLWMQRHELKKKMYRKYRGKKEEF